MKKILLPGLSALILTTAPALAGGDTHPSHACPATAFAGHYAGAFAGYAQNRLQVSDVDAWDASATTLANEDGAFAGGVQVGYDLVRCNTLFGVVADLTFANTRVDERWDSVFVAELAYRSGLDWMATGRVRAGAVLDSTLFYLTGGVAFAAFEAHFRSDFEGELSGWEMDDRRVGYVIGAGIEHLFSRRWSLTAEVLYADFSSKSDTITFEDDSQADSYTFRFDDEIVLGKVGLNYRVHRAHHPLEPLK